MTSRVTCACLTLGQSWSDCISSVCVALKTLGWCLRGRSSFLPCHTVWDYECRRRARFVWTCSLWLYKDPVHTWMWTLYYRKSPLARSIIPRFPTYFVSSHLNKSSKITWLQWGRGKWWVTSYISYSQRYNTLNNLPTSQSGIIFRRHRIIFRCHKIW